MTMGRVLDRDGFAGLGTGERIQRFYVLFTFLLLRPILPSASFVRFLSSSPLACLTTERWKTIPCLITIHYYCSIYVCCFGLSRVSGTLNKYGMECWINLKVVLISFSGFVCDNY
jgi:hypothetical protein